jgi:hypothetical protein
MVVALPDNATCCGLSVLPSLKDTFAEYVPAIEGWNFTLTVQLAADPTLVPQSFVWENSAAFAPVVEMLLMASAELPVLVRTIV